MVSHGGGSSALRAIAELLGTVGVVLSLVFVGLELRQGNAVARGATRQALADGSIELFLARATNPELQEQFRAFVTEPHESEFSCGERFGEACAFLNALLRHQENVFFQAEEGIVDEAVFQSYGFESRLYASPRFAAFWTSTKQSYHPDFVIHFERSNGL